MQSLANALYLLVARDFGPPEKRISNLEARMVAIPHVIDQAQGKSATSAAGPYRNGDPTGSRRDYFCARRFWRRCSSRPRNRKNELAPLQEATAKALEDYKKWLEEDLLKRSDGDFRIGADKFRKKLRFALASDLSPEEIMKRARADLAQTQDAIYQTALPLYKKYFPEGGEIRSRRQKESDCRRC